MVQKYRLCAGDLELLEKIFIVLTSERSSDGMVNYPIFTFPVSISCTDDFTHSNSPAVVCAFVIQDLLKRTKAYFDALGV